MPGTRLLILCTGNSCRSQMAEGLMRAAAARRGLGLEIHSAGTRPSSLHPQAVAALAEIGIDIRSHAAKSVYLFVGQRFDFVITVCNVAAETCPIFPGHSTRLHWPFEDPGAAVGPPEKIQAVFRRVRDGLAARIETWLDATFPPTQ